MHFAVLQSDLGCGSERPPSPAGVFGCSWEFIVIDIRLLYAALPGGDVIHHQRLIWGIDGLIEICVGGSVRIGVVVAWSAALIEGVALAGVSKEISSDAVAASDARS